MENTAESDYCRPILGDLFEFLSMCNAHALISIEVAFFLNFQAKKHDLNNFSLTKL